MEILLTNNKVATINDEDLVLVSGYKWCAMKRTTVRESYVAAASVYMGNYRSKTVLMHRLIAGVSDGQDVDHINRNSLDNRRDNLRIATKRQNCMNKSPRLGSLYKGVSKSKKSSDYQKPWRSYITVHGKQIYLGMFSTPENAAMAYNEAAIVYFGEFACLNVI